MKAISVVLLALIGCTPWVGTVPIYQRGQAECGVATVAMATGIPYQDVRGWFLTNGAHFDYRFSNPGVMTGNVVRFLRSHGYEAEYVEDVDLVQRRPSIVTAEYDNTVYHSLFWDGWHLIDPLLPWQQPRMTYVIVGQIFYRPTGNR